MIPRSKHVLGRHLTAVGVPCPFVFANCSDGTTNTIESPENRERPCKRCVALGKPEDCVELYSTRRRGRPKRATEEQQRQLEQLQRELLEHRQYMFAQDQARERGATTIVLGSGGPVSTDTFRDIKGTQWPGMQLFLCTLNFASCRGWRWC